MIEKKKIVEKKKVIKIKIKIKCIGCQQGQPNQLAHYGGCLTDPFLL